MRSGDYSYETRLPSRGSVKTVLTNSAAQDPQGETRERNVFFFEVDIVITSGDHFKGKVICVVFTYRSFWG